LSLGPDPAALSQERRPGLSSTPRSDWQVRLRGTVLMEEVAG